MTHRLLLTIALAEALAQGMKPGLWQFEQVISIPGAPPQGFEGLRQSWTHCVTPEQAKTGLQFRPERYGQPPEGASDCRITNLKTRPGYASYEIVCPSRKGGARILVEYRYTATSLRGEARPIEQNKMGWQVKGQYLGACPKSKR